MVIQVKHLQSRIVRCGLGAGLVLTGLTAWIAGTAYASAGDQGVIHGCYNRWTGALSILDRAAGRTCRPSQRPISWNQQGVPGPQGSPGASTAGPSGLDVIYVRGQAVSAEDAPQETVDCPTGHPYAVSGGGVDLSGDTFDDHPVDDPNGPLLVLGRQTHGISRLMEVPCTMVM